MKVHSRRRVVTGLLITAMLAATSLTGTGLALADEAVASDDVVMISATTLSPNQAEQTYTLTVVNAGAESVLGLEVASPVPAHQQVTSFELTQGRFDGASWSVGKLAPSASATLTLIAV